MDNDSLVVFIVSAAIVKCCAKLRRVCMFLQVWLKLVFPKLKKRWN